MSSPPSLPEDPRFRDIAEQIEKTRAGAILLDDRNHLIWVSSEFRALLIEGYDDEAIGYGRHIVENYMSDSWCRFITDASQFQMMQEEFPRLMYDTPGGSEGLKEIVLRAHRRWIAEGHELPEWTEAFDGPIEDVLAGFFAGIEPEQPPPVWTAEFDFVQGDLPPMKINEVHARLHGSDGSFFGTLVLYEPALPARVHALVARGDVGMYERMLRLVEPGRRQAAVLFADLEASTQLSRRLPSAAYFRLIRDLTTAIDEVVGGNGGIVGKHAGDGVTAFFLVDDIGSDSAATRAAISSAREISGLAKRVAGELSEEIGIIESELCKLNVGVHWGGRLYLGQLVTGGRLEVTALGDAVNECARIEESAVDGAILASKSLLEHLNDTDAAALEIDPDGVLYQTLGDLSTASEKARRDASDLPVTPL